VTPTGESEVPVNTAPHAAIPKEESSEPDDWEFLNVCERGNWEVDLLKVGTWYISISDERVYEPDSPPTKKI